MSTDGVRIARRRGTISGNLILKGKIQINEIKRKSYSKAFKGVKVGDILLLEIEVKDVTFGSSAGVYASTIYITNLRTGYKGNTTMTLCASALSNYEYIEVK